VVILILPFLGKTIDTPKGNDEKRRQRRSRHFVVLTYWKYAPRVKMTAALLDDFFDHSCPYWDSSFLEYIQALLEKYSTASKIDSLLLPLSGIRLSPSLVFVSFCELFDC